MSSKLGIALLIFTVGNFAFSINAINDKNQEISYWKTEAKQYFREKEDAKTELEGLIEVIALEKNNAHSLKMYVIANTTYGKCIKESNQNESDTIACGGTGLSNFIYNNLLDSRQNQSKFLVPELDKLLKTKSSLGFLKGDLE